jgi:hypothetical protein
MIKDIFSFIEGDVFLCKEQYGGKQTYWKVSKVRNEPDRVHYHVFKCNKNGKQFKSWNGFSFYHRDKEYYNKNTKITYIGNFIDAPKAKDGTVEGARKRRITHLKESIAAMQKELERLECL